MLCVKINLHPETYVIRANMSIIMRLVHYNQKDVYTLWWHLAISEYYYQWEWVLSKNA